MRQVVIESRHKTTVLKGEESGYEIGCVCGAKFGWQWQSPPTPIDPKEKSRILAQAQEHEFKRYSLDNPWAYAVNDRLYGPHTISITEDGTRASCTCGAFFKGIYFNLRTDVFSSKTDEEIFKCHEECLKEMLERADEEDFDRMGH